MFDFFYDFMSDLGFESGSIITIDHVIIIICFVLIFEFLSSLIYVIFGGLKK